MRFVFGNRLLTTSGGTEVHLATLGTQLQRLGHEVVMYAPEVGAFGEHLRDLGFVVHDRTSALPEACDVVLSQDLIVVHDLAARYPEAFHVFRVCGDTYDFQAPPQLPGVVDLVIALSERYVRLAQAMAHGVPVRRFSVPVDTERLAPGGPLRATPRRAVLLGNYPQRHELVRSAWSELGLDVDVVGGDRQRFGVGQALADADIVVAKSRAAVDAMACGRAVYLLDLFGGDGWITPDNYAALAADNFAGLASGRVIDRAALQSDLADYRPEMGMHNRDLAVQHHNAREHAVAFVHAVQEGIRDAGGRAVTRPGSDVLAEMGRMARLQWAWEQLVRDDRYRAWGARDRLLAVEQESTTWAQAFEKASGENAVLTGERDRLAHALQIAVADRDALQRRLDVVNATRVWRTACAYWSLRDRLRRSHRRCGSSTS